MIGSFEEFICDEAPVSEVHGVSCHTDFMNAGSGRVLIVVLLIPCSRTLNLVHQDVLSLSILSIVFISAHEVPDHFFRH